MCVHTQACFLETRLGAELTLELSGLGDCGMSILKGCLQVPASKTQYTEGYRAWARPLMRCET